MSQTGIALVGAGAQPSTREAWRKRLRNNELNDKEIEIQVAETAPQFPTFDIPGGQVGMINLGEMLGKAFGQRSKPRRHCSIRLNTYDPRQTG